MSEALIICPPPFLGSSVTAASEVTSLPATALLQEDVAGPAWRALGKARSLVALELRISTSADPGATAPDDGLGFAAAPAASPPRLDVVVLAGHNAKAIYAGPQWRLRLYTAPLAARIRPPVASVVSTNMTGTFDLINHSPDLAGTGMTATSGTTDMALRVLFAQTYAGSGTLPLTTTSGAQKVRVRLKHSSGTGTAVTYRIDLYQAGSFVSTLVAATTLTAAAGSIVVETSFSRSALASGTVVPEIKIIGTHGSTGSVNVEAVEMILDHTGYTADSSWVLFTQPVSTLDLRLYAVHRFVPGIQLAFGTTYYLHAEILVGAAVADDAFEATKLFAAQGIDIPSVDGSVSPAIAQSGSRRRSKAGFSRPARSLLGLRQGNARSTALTSQEALDTSVDAVARALGGSRGAFFLFYPGDVARLGINAFMGYFPEGVAPQGEGWAGGESRYGLTWKVEEV